MNERLKNLYLPLPLALMVVAACGLVVAMMHFKVEGAMKIAGELGITIITIIGMFAPGAKSSEEIAQKHAAVKAPVDPPGAESIAPPPQTISTVINVTPAEPPPLVKSDERGSARMDLMSACAVVGLVLSAMLACGTKVAAPTPAQGERWLGYAAALEACDTVRDAGADARAEAFEACVKQKGLDR